MARDILPLSPPSYHFFERIFREDSKHLDVPPYKEGGWLLTTVKRLDGELFKVLKRVTSTAMVM